MKQYLLKVWMTAALSLLVVGGVWGQESYTPGYPNVSDITHESAKLNVSASVGGGNRRPTHYALFVVLESTDTAPEIQDVIDWSDDANSGAIPEGRYGDIGLFASNNEFSIEAFGLDAETAYVVYIVTTENDYETVVIETTEPTAVPFTTTAAPTPLTATLSPADDATNVPVSTSTFVLTFSEDVEFTGAENMYAGLYKNGSSVEGQLLATSNGNVVIDNLNNSLTISFSHSFDYDTDYYITIPSGAVQAVATAVEFPGLSAGEWSFTTEAEPIPADPPYVVTDGYSPAPGTPEVARDTELRLTFNEAIEFGDLSALFLIHRDGSVRPLLSGSEEVSISVDELELIIDLSESPLTQYNTDYYVLIEPGFVKSKATGADFEGIALVDPGTISDQAWYFKTETAPPFWAEGYPMIDQQDASKLNLNALADQTGIVYAVITSNPAAPSAAQIALGQNAVGDSALVSVNGSVESIIDPTVLTVNFATSVPLGTVYFLHTVLKNNDDKYSDVESLAVDRIVPKINEDETYPEDGYSNMDISEDIVIVFSEHVFGADGLELTSNSFSLTHLVGGAPTPVSVDFSVSSTSERTTVTLNPDDDLVPITDYTITIQSVYDASGNASGVLTWSFQTDGEFTWTGRGNVTVWEDSNNWGGTYVSGKSVVISGAATAFPIVEEGDVSVHNLTIEPAAVLTQTGGTINVSGEFHLLSNEDINASYLPQGGVLNVEGAKVFVHQHIVANPFWPFFLSSPTDSTNALNSGSGYLMAYYDNPTDTWVQIGANARMESGRGYSVYAQNNLVFRGNINRIAAGHTAVRTAGQGYGWNMFGNPFTAGLDWGGIVVDTATLENSFWLWDPRQDKYTAFNSEAGLGTGDTEGVIPSNHGFVVKVKLEHLESYIEMPPSATVANGPSLLKSSKMNKPPFVRIAVTKDNFEDRAVVAFIDNATAGTDKYDTEKKLGSSGPFELYSLGDGSRLSINSFPLLTGQRDVPLGLIVRKKGSYSLTLNDSNLEGVDVFLIDNLTEDIIDLKSVAEYTFSVDKTGTDVSRLALRFVGSLTTQLPNNPGLDTSENLKVFSQDKRIFYEVGEGLVGSVVSVFDSSGRLLHNEILKGLGRNSYEVFYPGVYLIKVSREGHIGVSQKVVVK